MTPPPMANLQAPAGPGYDGVILAGGCSHGR